MIDRDRWEKVSAVGYSIMVMAAGMGYLSDRYPDEQKDLAKAREKVRELQRLLGMMVSK